jgi:hypothetical protein
MSGQDKEVIEPMINIIVSLVTAIAVAFLAVWFLRPAFRLWVERPKYTMLKND